MERIANAFLGRLSLGRWAYATFVLCTTAITLPAQTLNTLFSFDGANGKSPLAGLIQGTDGNLYGTTASGGAYSYCGEGGCGTIFKITPSGTLTTLHSFCAKRSCLDGALPEAALVQATNGDFYGTTYAGGPSNIQCEGCGTVFKITPSGILTTLYTFCAQAGCTDGAFPVGTLIQASDGNFYGTAAYGGASSSSAPYGVCRGITILQTGCGTVFKITPSGTLTTLYRFCSQAGCTDGATPSGGLVEAPDGNFYGTTLEGGTTGVGGTVFKITPSGILTTYSFCSQTFCTGGELPVGGLIQATDGNFYGTSEGADAGTIFKFTAGTLTELNGFGSYGMFSEGLTDATDGNFYGTTFQGGATGYGIAFKITPSGALTTLYNFCSQTGCTDGSYSQAAMFQATNGDFYGTTSEGGANNDGTIFSISEGRGPFVRIWPHFGKVGTAIRILGNDLTGTTSVTFNGAAASFTVVSATEIKATVPIDATTGTAQVVTPGGTLSSGGPFLVRP